MDKISKSLTTQDAQNILLELLKNDAKERKQLIAECLQHIDLSPKELKDKRPGAALNKAKCTIGNALSQLIRMDHLKQENGIVSLVQRIEDAQSAIKRDPHIRGIILRIIGASKLTRTALLNKVIEIYIKEVDRNEKSATIRSDSGRILSDLLKTEDIIKKDGYFILSYVTNKTDIFVASPTNNQDRNAHVQVEHSDDSTVKTEVPEDNSSAEPIEETDSVIPEQPDSLTDDIVMNDNTASPQTVQDSDPVKSEQPDFDSVETEPIEYDSTPEPTDGTDSVKSNQSETEALEGEAVGSPTKMERNRTLFLRLSDEEFVNRSVELLECLYRKKYPTLSVQGENTDGPNDGGIDGNIVVSDELWGNEKIVLQMKHINSPTKKYVPLCEIQEFCGVLSAEKSATKGIFFTNKGYEAKSVQFAQKYTFKPFVLIDGEKWLALAKSCGYVLPEPEV